MAGKVREAGRQKGIKVAPAAALAAFKQAVGTLGRGRRKEIGNSPTY